MWHQSWIFVCWWAKMNKKNRRSQQKLTLTSVLVTGSNVKADLCSPKCLYFMCVHRCKLSFTCAKIPWGSLPAQFYRRLKLKWGAPQLRFCRIISSQEICAKYSSECSKMFSPWAWISCLFAKRLIIPCMAWSHKTHTSKLLLRPPIIFHKYTLLSSDSR